MVDNSDPSGADHYATLGVDRSATTQDIKKAFRQVARECHPDVAGKDPKAEERFKKARAAYEALVDPVERARYDRRRARPSSPFGFGGMGAGGPFSGMGGGRHDPGNDLNLDDIFNDFGDIGGFGFGAGAPNPAPGARRPRRPVAEPGTDIHTRVEVDEDTAERGGTVTVTYWRDARADDGIGLNRIEELAEVRVPPGVQDGATLRVARMGNAGPGGGRPGDLICSVRLAPRGPSRPSEAASRQDASHEGTRSDPLPLPVSVTEALLGGRVEADLPDGSRVRLVIPPCTSSGTVFRVRCRKGNEGERDAFYFALKVVMPPELDSESRALVEELARLNPYSPRG